MTDNGRLYSGLTRAAWGYLLLTFDINLGTMSILPAFVGWLLLLSAIGYLAPERRDLGLLRPIGILLAIWSAADWLLKLVGGGVDGLFLPLTILMAAAGLYFHFQFLTDMAALAETCVDDGGLLAEKLRFRRTAYTVLTTAVDVMVYLPLPADPQAVVVIVLAVANVIVAILIVTALFSLRKCFN